MLSPKAVRVSRTAPYRSRYTNKPGGLINISIAQRNGVLTHLRGRGHPRLRRPHPTGRAQCNQGWQVRTRGVRQWGPLEPAVQKNTEGLNLTQQPVGMQIRGNRLRCGGGMDLSGPAQPHSRHHPGGDGKTRITKPDAEFAGKPAKSGSVTDLHPPRSRPG